MGSFIAAYVVAVIGLTACILTFINLCGKVEVGLSRHIRQTAFRHLQELPFSFYDKTPVGYLIARLTSDTQRLGDTVAWSLMDIMPVPGHTRQVLNDIILTFNVHPVKKRTQ